MVQQHLSALHHQCHSGHHSRFAVVAGDAGQLAKVCWLPCRIMLCMKADVELRAHMFEVAMKDGLLGPQVPVKQTAAAWVQLWTTASQLEKDALMLMLNQRTRTQVGGKMRVYVQQPFSSLTVSCHMTQQPTSHQCICCSSSAALFSRCCPGTLYS